MPPEPSVIRVAVVEDAEADRQRLSQLLRQTSGLEQLAACSTAEEAVRMLPNLVPAPDIILMDIGLPGLSGIECVRRLRGRMAEVQFMMLTVVEDHERIYQSLAAGATGYLLKKATDTQVLEAIRELHAGGAPMSGQIARQVVAAFQAPAPSGPAERLTPVEQEVLRCLARGLLYKEVAEALGIALGTVRTHVWRIYRKLQARNRTEAVRKGLPGPKY
ncbi:MAG: response regulator transcription factor [Verrucomicrobiales bacterium]|nr:response regulator transcription factor [Verrucomicrobiales bacterium]